MNIVEFQERYGTEEQCRQYLFEKRWGEGFVCPKCGYSEFFNIQARHLYQCKSCNHQVSVTAGTIMDKTRTPLVKWFMAFYLMAENSNGISALALAKRIGVAYYTAWTMCHKIRYMMGTRNMAKPKKQRDTGNLVLAERKKKPLSKLKKNSNSLGDAKDSKFSINKLFNF